MVTHSTLYAIRHTNYPRPAPCWVHSIISTAIADPTWRSRVGVRPRSKNFLFASCGPQIPLTWAKVHTGLWVKHTTVLCIPVKLSHMDMLKSDFSTTFNWTCIISRLPALICSYKKTKMDNINVILEK